MHDSQIKSYCMWARRELISEVERRCAIYDIAENPSMPVGADAVNGRVLTAVEKRQRGELLSMVKRDGYDQTLERAAYTWFNRIMAIRFMEVNDRLPSRTRMFSSNDGSFKPQVLSEALTVDIEGVDRVKIAELVQAGDDEATFRYLFLAQCYELAKCMPDVFERVGSTMEMLLPDGLLRPDGAIAKIITDIDETDWTEGVEIVGWMYQYYNQERKDEYFASKRKATADDIAPATQLFTPEWIVRYLTENSLGRLWMLNDPESKLASQMDYYIAPDGDPGEFLEVEGPEEISVLDPACGSGHILVYAFDLMAAMYSERGYARRDIPRLILEKNLTGIEVDPRAAAMASFALTMKACEYDSRFLRRGVKPRITVLQSVELGEEQRRAIASVRHGREHLGAPSLLDQTDLLDALAHLGEVGSLLEPTPEDMGALRATSESLENEVGLFGSLAHGQVMEAIGMLEPLAAKYDVVVANPPYLQKSALRGWASRWIEHHYAEEKYDLCTCFIKRGADFAKRDGYVAEITMQSWMFLSSYEKMRKKIISSYGIVSMAHLGARAFDAIGGEVVSTTATVFSNSRQKGCGSYFRLVDDVGEKGKSDAFKEAIRDSDCGWFYRVDEEDFKSIPGWPIAYWTSKSQLAAFTSKRTIVTVAKLCKGMVTMDNGRFLRLWWEVSKNDSCVIASNAEEAINSNCRWFPYNKGGAYRKWYGNREWFVNWKNDGKEIKEKVVDAYGGGSYTKEIRNEAQYFKGGFTWSNVSTGQLSVRTEEPGTIFDSTGITGFAVYPDATYSLMALLNSSVINSFMSFLSPTLHFNTEPVGSVPVVDLSDEKSTAAAKVVARNISICRIDWDSFETSWDFQTHPLVQPGEPLVERQFKRWQVECRERFDALKANEEEINRIFARIYHMEGEVPIEVPDDKVSVRLADRNRDVKSLISYAVGCIMGRYSLDKPGLVLANQGDGLDEYLAQVPEPTLTPDEDGIIPLTDVEYFHDDAVGLFCDFLKAAYGAEILEENLQFVADSLNGGDNTRQTIRDYFRNDFFKDHCQTYSVASAGKRPIYWLFDSGKKGGFRALFYMHRYTPDLLARLRTEYVHPQQERYRNQIGDIDRDFETADKHDIVRLKKLRKKLSEQLAEINAYEEKVHHLADQMIEIDLDDGVKHNYALFQDVLAKIK